MINHYTNALKQYAVFSGRASRSQYWYFALCSAIISIILSIIDNAIGLGGETIGLLSGLYSLAVLVPSLAVLARRLHDTGKSGWWILIGLIPVIGAIVLIIFAVMDSQPGTNEYGPNPKGVSGGSQGSAPAAAAAPSPAPSAPAESPVSTPSQTF